MRYLLYVQGDDYATECDGIEQLNLELGAAQAEGRRIICVKEVKAEN